MTAPRYPSLYQMNTRVRLAELSRELGRPATLDDLPDAEIDGLAELGFDWVWLLSVWRTGPEGRRVSRESPEWRREFQETLPDLREEDIAGAGFAVAEYKVHPDLGGDAALARLRERLRGRGLRLMLASRRTSAAGRKNRPIRGSRGSIKLSSPCSAGLRCATESGSCSNVRLPGRATGPGTVSWRSAGRDQAATG